MFSNDSTKSVIKNMLFGGQGLGPEAKPWGGLWGLSPPKFDKVSPSITEDEYIYTNKTQLKYVYIY